MVLKKVLPSALVFSGLALAQGTIDTYAGNDALFAGSGQPAIAAQLVGPNNCVVDGQGNVYISAPGLSMVLKVAAATGVITVFAGDGLNRFAGDGGLAVGASLSSPQGLAFDSEGNLFIADPGNSRVRKVTPAGLITTVAGGGNGGDGSLATQAGLSVPAGIVLDKSGNLYIVDYGNGQVRMVSASTGIISTIAGTGATGFSGDGGPATQASFTNPDGIAIDSSGNLYIADVYSSRIRKFFPGGIITTVAGGGSSLGDNGPATQAQLNGPQGVAVDASGNLYIADTYDERIRRVGTNGIITTIAGTGQAGFSGDGSVATGAMFSTPYGVALDASGKVYVADLDNNRIRRVVPGGTVTTIAGTTSSVGDGGPSEQARLTSPQGVAVDSSGNLYIADNSANRVRKVTPAGTITTLAGTGQTGRGGDNGPAAPAILNDPNSVAVDSGGNLYIADSGNAVIRRVDASTGKITLFAGNYTCCYAGTGTGGDGGPATGATLWYPGGVAGRDRRRRRPGHGRHPLVPGWRGGGWVGERVPHNQRRERRHVRSADWAKRLEPRRTPGHHRRDNPPLGRRHTSPTRIHRRRRAAAPSSLRRRYQYRCRFRWELVYRGRGQSPGEEGRSGRIHHQHCSRQRSERLLRRRGLRNSGGRALSLVGRGGRGGEPLHRILQLRAEGHFQRNHRPLYRQRATVWLLRRWRTRDGRLD
jgi:sugar lactone lactonase YvrE